MNGQKITKIFLHYVFVAYQPDRRTKYLQIIFIDEENLQKRIYYYLN